MPAAPVVMEPVAVPASKTLSTCFADNTTGKERKDLARWIFVSMSAHPEISSLAKVSPDDRLAVNKSMAALVTRLLTENCPRQAREAMAAESSAGMIAAFRSLGEIAMQELTSNPEVSVSVGSYAQYLDEKTIQAISGTGK